VHSGGIAEAALVGGLFYLKLVCLSAASDARYGIISKHRNATCLARKRRRLYRNRGKATRRGHSRSARRAVRWAVCDSLLSFHRTGHTKQRRRRLSQVRHFAIIPSFMQRGARPKRPHAHIRSQKPRFCVEQFSLADMKFDEGAR
jgi:hypothetical protein